ncbi:MAG TPA: hypothetical protein DDZ76_11465 [Xanthomonadales bacterium]|nr:hypothetical protein [Xanthomonadales bacterium]
MRWYGKIFGVIAGLLLTRGQPAGALIGLLIGHAFDADWFKSPKPDPYQELGLTEEASDSEVERAYRRLISQYHPDRLAGAAKELRDQAETRAKAINRAYEAIQKARRRKRS